MNRKKIIATAKRRLQQGGLIVFAALFSMMTMQSSGFAAFSETEYNIIITPDNMPIIWKKDPDLEEVVTYGEAELLTASELLQIDVCVPSSDCSDDAISQGAIYYKLVLIPDVGYVAFYYNALGELIGSEPRPDITVDLVDESTTDVENEIAALGSIEVPTSAEDAAIKDYFGDFNQFAVGATSASFNVDPSGSANYEIPIYAPPGVGDLKPSISINYNSQAGAGLLGVGFNISGLSVISRCPRTRATDGITRVAIPPDFTNEDAFCLDGQRLIQVNSYANGTVGAEYRTEIDSFSRVTITNADAYGPREFEVKTKAGQTMKYGDTSNTRIELRGHVDSGKNNKTVLLWPVENIEDVAGNNIHFDYTLNADGNTGYRPDKITYGLSGFQATIQFEYQTRTDSRVGYQQGYKLSSTHRMHRIDVKVDTSVVREYKLGYDESSTTGRNRINEIQECVGSECFPPITFDWTQGPTGFESMGSLKTLQDGMENHQDKFHFSDFSGDGKADVIIGPNSNGGWIMIEGEDDGLSNYSSLHSGWEAGEHDHPDRFRMMDVNGDGHMDMVMGPDANGNWTGKQRNSDGTQLVSIGSGAMANGVFSGWKDKTAFIHPIDENGDGKQDLMMGPDSNGSWDLLRSNGNNFTAHPDYFSHSTHEKFSSTLLGPDYTKVFDVDGDGLEDILLGPNENGHWDLIKNTGSGFNLTLNYILADGLIGNTG